MAATRKRTARSDNGEVAAAPPEHNELRDAIVIHSPDGGASFSYALPPGQISPFAWPTVLRQIAAKMERELARGVD
jgi:hypothetical protein